MGEVIILALLTVAVIGFIAVMEAIDRFFGQ